MSRWEGEAGWYPELGLRGTQMPEDPSSRGPRDQQALHLGTLEQGHLLTLMLRAQPPPCTPDSPASPLPPWAPGALYGPCQITQLSVNNQHQPEPLGSRAGARTHGLPREQASSVSSPGVMKKRVSGINQQVQCTGDARIPPSPRARRCSIQPGGTEVQGSQDMGQRPSSWKTVNIEACRGGPVGCHPALFFMEMCTLEAPSWMEAGEGPAPRAPFDPGTANRVPLSDAFPLGLQVPTEAFLRASWLSTLPFFLS